MLRGMFMAFTFRGMGFPQKDSWNYISYCPSPKSQMYEYANIPYL